MLSTRPSVHTECSVWVFRVLSMLIIFSHVPFLGVIKCSKWKHLQPVATDQSELNVLECPCHKMTSTSWARSDSWVFFHEINSYSWLLFYWMPPVSTHSASEMTEQATQNAIYYYHILLGTNDVGNYMWPKLVKLIWVCGLASNLEIPYLSTSWIT